MFQLKSLESITVRLFLLKILFLKKCIKIVYVLKFISLRYISDIFLETYNNDI